MTAPDPYKEAYRHLQRELASPPAGWFPFGTHLDTPVQLEWWGTGDDLMPLWERPVPSKDRVTAAAEALAGIPLQEFANDPEHIAKAILAAIDQHDADLAPTTAPEAQG